MVALTVPTWVALTRANKKRPELFSPRRLGSPPPELPNHEMDIRELVISCKRHFSNRLFPGSLRRALIGKQTEAVGRLSKFLAASMVARASRDPSTAAVLLIREAHPPLDCITTLAGRSE